MRVCCLLQHREIHSRRLQIFIHESLLPAMVSESICHKGMAKGGEQEVEDDVVEEEEVDEGERWFWIADTTDGGGEMSCGIVLIHSLMVTTEQPDALTSPSLSKSLSHRPHHPMILV